MEEILVVDDDGMIRELIKRIVEGAGIVAHCVSNGEEALEKIREKSFSLMITDLHMPGLSGMELSVKGLALAPDMPIIMNTGAPSPKISRLAREIGIARVLTKPFLPKEMLETIRSVLGKTEQQAPQTRASEAKDAGGKAFLYPRNCYVHGA